MNTEKQPLWKIASFPFNTGIYNGLDYISKGYYKHVMENFGRYPEHLTADLNSYQFRTLELDRIEETYKIQLRDQGNKNLCLSTISETPEKEKSERTRVNAKQISWILEVQPTDPVVNKHWLNGSEYMSFTLFDYDRAKNNPELLYEILTEVYEKLPHAFKKLSDGRVFNSENTPATFSSDSLLKNLNAKENILYPRNSELDAANKKINLLENELAEKDEELEKLRNKFDKIVSILTEEKQDNVF